MDPKEKPKQEETAIQEDALQKVTLEDEDEGCDCCGDPIQPSRNSSDCLDND